ncbi:PREDICTED: uncharacterized protein LOC106806708 [Priapulus caudatus]|uniref:Uncharacterized protein LOC106806708 n=1 Tax=Priapulus caudatus TaxID=37621 RepID=A0ABM1DW90_PRICU|nr:PREDICTED: uncharacterized protein LOC106806708 [Priapulus caudatus]
MLKHVSTTNLRRKASLDTLGSSGSSIGSRGSRSSLQTVGVPSDTSTTSIASQEDCSAIKVYARAVRSDIEYKTILVSKSTTSRDMVSLVLNKCKMKTKDPKLYYVTMEVGLKKRDHLLRNMIILEDDASPLVLQSCHPNGGSRFYLSMRRGGLVKIHVANLIEGLYYKSLLISQMTSAREVIRLLLHCYRIEEDPDRFSLREVCKIPENFYERKLMPDDCPLRFQECWDDERHYAFILRREPQARRRRRRRVQSMIVPSLPLRDGLATSKEEEADVTCGHASDGAGDRPATQRRTKADDRFSRESVASRNTCYFV